MLAEKLRQLRIEQGLTQGELGERTGLSASAIGMYEQGRREPGHEILARLCRTLGTTTSQMLGDGGDCLSLASRDLGKILESLGRCLAEMEGFTLDGHILSYEEQGRIAAALQLGARLALGTAGRLE